MAKNTALLKRLQKDGATDTPTPPAGAPPPDSKLETTPAAADGCDAARDVIAMSRHFHKVISEETPPPAALPPSGTVAPPVTDPHLVWTNLIRTPQGQRLTDPRIQQLSPQRFDTVFLAALKSAFLAGWEGRVG